MRKILMMLPVAITGLGFGGSDAGEHPGAVLGALDSGLDVVKGSAPGPRAFHSAVVLGHRLYVFGGVSSDGLMNDLHYFDVRSSWSGELARGSCCVDGQEVDLVDPRPSPRVHAGMATLGQQLVVFGGLTATGVANDVHVYDEATATWSGQLTTLGDAPEPRAAAAVAGLGDLVVVFGGTTASSDVFVLNMTTHGWSTLAAATGGPGARAFAGVATADGIFFYVSGGTVVSDATMPTIDGACVHEAIRDNLVLDDTWRFDVVNQVWSQITPTGFHTAGHAMFTTRSPDLLLYAFCGVDHRGIPVDRHAVLQNAWIDVSREADPPSCRIGSTVAPFDDGRLALEFGGVDCSAADHGTFTADLRFYSRVTHARPPDLDIDRIGGDHDYRTSLSLYRFLPDVAS